MTWHPTGETHPTISATDRVTGYTGFPGTLMLHQLAIPSGGLWLAYASLKLSAVVGGDLAPFMPRLYGPVGRYGDTDTYVDASPGSGSDSASRQLSIVTACGAGDLLSFDLTGLFTCTSCEVDWTMFAVRLA